MDRPPPTMPRRILGCFVVAALLWQLWPPSHAQASTPSPIIIGEVAWAGSPLSNADEWVELWNTSDAAVSLNGFRLDGVGPEGGILFDESHTIGANDAFLIANYGSEHENAAAMIEPDVITSALSLSNSSLGITLVDPSGSVIDRAGDGGTPLAGSTNPKASMIRLAPVLSGEEATSWTTATASENFYAGVDAYGTPGICDGCITVESAPPETATPEEVTTTEPMPAATSSTSQEPPITVTETQEAPTQQSETVTTDPAESATTTTEGATEITQEASQTEEVSATTTIPEASITPPSPQFPEIKLSISGSFVAGEEVNFDASSSTDPNGDIVYFTWNFGDGNSATSSKATHVYEEPGDYAFELIATDTTFRSYATTTLTIAPPPPDVRLNEVHPAPIDGPEWIELTGVTQAQLPDLIGYTIEDGSGTIFRFTESSLEQISVLEPFILVELSSSKLNNSGDSVLLYRPDGSLADGVVFENTKKGMSWIRYPDETGDWRDGEATPLAANVYEEPQPIQTESEITQLATTQTVAGNSSILTAAATELSSAPSSKNESVSQTTVTQATSKPASVSTVTVKKTAQKATTKSATPATAKTSGTSTSSDPDVLETSIEQIMTIPPNTRITLSGVVGTKTGMIGKHQFVLLAPNGRGIHVTASNKQPSPEFGTRVRVIGTLMNNDDGLYIRMGTKDQWSEEAGENLVKIRETNLEDIGIEDAWSLVQVSGYVIESSQTKALIDTGAELIEVQFKKTTDYRAVRLNPQDKIRVTGLLDSQSADLKLLPRDAAEVEILEHATLEQADAPSGPSLPGWMPFGAAGLTVAATEGVKRIRKWKYEQKVQKLIEKAKE